MSGAVQEREPEVPSPDSVIEVGADKVKVGHGNFAIIAGPCSVESEAQIISVAKASRPPEPPCSGRRVQAPHLPIRLSGA